MATPRLSFLYPSLYKRRRPLNARQVYERLEYIQVRKPPRKQFHVSSRRQLEPFRERHGTAVEPPPGLGGASSSPPRIGPACAQEPAEIKSDTALAGQSSRNSPDGRVVKEGRTAETNSKDGVAASEAAPSSSSSTPSMEQQSTNPPLLEAGTARMKLETVLHTSLPSSSSSSSSSSFSP